MDKFLPTSYRPGFGSAAPSRLSAAPSDRSSSLALSLYAVSMRQAHATSRPASDGYSRAAAHPRIRHSRASSLPSLVLQADICTASGVCPASFAHRVLFGMTQQDNRVYVRSNKGVSRSKTYRFVGTRLTPGVEEADFAATPRNVLGWRTVGGCHRWNQFRNRWVGIDLFYNAVMSPAASARAATASETTPRPEQ